MKQQATPETDALAKHERHNTVAETRYWCDQYLLQARRLERQRDELLAALKLMRDAWDMSDETKAKRERRAKAWVASNAAIASATGEKP